jgi:hypothetical protein
MDIPNKLIVALTILLILFASFQLLPAGLRTTSLNSANDISGFVPSSNETGNISAEIVSFISLNLTDSSVSLGNISNEDILNTSIVGGGAVPDVLTVRNVGSSPAEVDFWSRYSLFYDKFNDSGKSCNGGGITDCRLNALRSENDGSYKFATESITGTGCLINAYELTVNGFQNVIVDGVGGISAPQIADSFAGGDEFSISFRVDVPKFEESGAISTNVYVSGVEDGDGKDVNC